MSANFNFTSDADLIGDFVEGDRPVKRSPAAEVQVDPPLKTLPPLNYDFDIITVAPDAAQQAHLDALAALGQDVDEEQIQARWRDPATVAAMDQASRGVRELFKAAGFGTIVSGKRMPVGSYPAEEGEARHEIVMRLTNTIAEADAAALDWAPIDIAAFFKAHAEATSVRTQSVDPDAVAIAPNKKKFALIGLVIGLALLMIAGLSAL